MKKALCAALAAAGLMVAGSAGAAIVITLQSDVAQFQVTLASYPVVVNATSQIDNCSLQGATACGFVILDSSEFPDEARVVGLSADGSTISRTFDFQDDALTHDGVYNTILGPSAVLTVRNTAAVPEPSAWALMIAGFGLAGAALRRRRELPAD